MIRLDDTTKKLQAVLAGAVTTNQLACVVCYSDHTSSTYGGGTQITDTNSTTAVDICAAPASSTVRDIDFLNIRNRDTAAATITLMIDVSGTDTELVKVTLAVGDVLHYIHGHGWSVMDGSGNTKSSNITTTTLLNSTVHTDTVTNTATKGSLIVGNATPAWDELGVGTNGHVLTADSAETHGVKWAAPTGGTIPVIVLQDQKSASTSGGTFTSGPWRTRDLNTEVLDTGSHCTLSANQFTLAAGTYEIEASAPANYVQAHQCKLYNVSDSADVCLGTTEYSAISNTDEQISRSLINSQFTIASTKTFEIQHRCQTTRGSGLGMGQASGHSWGTTIFTEVKLRKVA